MQNKKRRALLSVSDKTGIVELAQALIDSGFEIIATGKTRELLQESKIETIEVEKISKTPEAFGGRMKTLAFPLLSGILYHRERDASEAVKLSIEPIEVVVVNFYPFEKQSAIYQNSERTKEDLSELIEKIDIGGPTLVRAAAKNSPEVSVVVDPHDYSNVISDLKRHKKITHSLSQQLSHKAWLRVYSYDRAIVETLVSDSLCAEEGQKFLNPDSNVGLQSLRYGENPHQKAAFSAFTDSPLRWFSKAALSPHRLSYNNFLDVSAGYNLLNELVQADPKSHHCVIVKHLSPCGVASVPEEISGASRKALELAWEGDSVSSFGGVVLFSHPIDESVFSFFYTHFIDTLVFPIEDEVKYLSEQESSWSVLLSKRKSLKVVSISSWQSLDKTRSMEVCVPGGRLMQEVDSCIESSSEWKCLTKEKMKPEWTSLSHFGISCVKSLKSNAVALVRSVELNGRLAKQLVGTGQGQPNRVEALEWLAIPRAKRVLGEQGLSSCVLFSDAFFPFPDAVEISAKAGIRAIVQPGGSIKDKECVEMADRYGLAMAFSGKRHFKH